jgi:hypothetical protein
VPHDPDTWLSIDDCFREPVDSDEFLDLTWDGGWNEAVDHGHALGDWSLSYGLSTDSDERGHLEGFHAPAHRVMRT